MDPRVATLVTRLLYVTGALIVAVWLARHHAPAHPACVGKAFIERACADGDPAGCFALAEQTRTGTCRARDVAAASGLYARACERGHDAACAAAMP